ncbi:hypothetical protein H696_05210 [Fonticula alba]|uniref:Uncharacterized protein n=1 Tax=Fonticula alba TaxID=691883 RepID=A0A058Z2C6_FONAL|nr:hypothetical protein H696_05210 [Fonticula alba]KCV68291.1 hypothetical protein H696_05210 [Fonticula alba]|eukprot:XP_009497345.1 hypothetical protein H696_05210 [Fonticula alba]
MADGTGPALGLPAEALFLQQAASALAALDRWLALDNGADVRPRVESLITIGYQLANTALWYGTATAASGAVSLAQPDISPLYSDAIASELLVYKTGRLSRLLIGLRNTLSEMMAIQRSLRLSLSACQHHALDVTLRADADPEVRAFRSSTLSPVLASLERAAAVLFALIPQRRGFLDTIPQRVGALAQRAGAQPSAVASFDWAPLPAVEDGNDLSPDGGTASAEAAALDPRLLHPKAPDDGGLGVAPWLPLPRVLVDELRTALQHASDTLA